MKHKEVYKEFKERFWLVYLVTLISCTVALCWSVYVFTLGFHNVDVGCNLRYLSELYDDNIYDLASDGKIYTGAQLMSRGYDQYTAAYSDSVVYAFLIGICLSGLAVKICSKK